VRILGAGSKTQGGSDYGRDGGGRRRIAGPRGLKYSAPHGRPPHRLLLHCIFNPPLSASPGRRNRVSNALVCYSVRRPANLARSTMKSDDVALRGRGARPPSPSSPHRQTVPSHTDELDIPPPYSSVVPGPSSARSSSDSSVSAGEDVPLQHTTRRPRHEAYSPAAPMGSTEDTRGPRGLFGSDDRPEDGPFGSLRAGGTKRGSRPRGYDRQPGMTPYSSETFDPSKYAGQPGCCYSKTGGAWCSERGGCCFSSDGGVWWSGSEGCCCSQNHGAWCSNNHGCCFSDHGGFCCSDNGGAWCSDGNVSSLRLGAVPTDANGLQAK